MAIEELYITDTKELETNVNWYWDGEPGNDIVLNRPIKQIADKVNEIIRAVDPYTSSISTVESLTEGCIILNGSSGTILIDDAGQKRISWNEGEGDFALKSGSYFNGTNNVFSTATDGAGEIFFETDAQAGTITLRTGPISTGLNNTISWTNTLIISSTSDIVTLNGSQLITAGNIGTFNGDADTLDGLDSLQFLRSDIDTSLTGGLTVNKDNLASITINRTTDTNYCGLSFNTNGLKNWNYYTISDGSGDLRLTSNNYDTDGSSKNTIWTIDWDTGIQNFHQTPTVNGYDVITTNTISAFNGDATTLDGLDSTQFLRSDTSDELNGQLTINYDFYNGLVLNKSSDIVGSGIRYTINDVNAWQLVTLANSSPDLRLQSFDYQDSGLSKYVIWTVDWETGVQDFNRKPTVSGSEVVTFNDNDTFAPDKLSTAVGDAPSYSARAWAVFDATSGVDILRSKNIATITQVATGQFSINFIEDMETENYAIVGTTGGDSSSSPTYYTGVVINAVIEDAQPTAQRFIIHTRMAYGGGARNYKRTSVVVFE